jgi:hypothetical protein
VLGGVVPGGVVCGGISVRKGMRWVRAWEDIESGIGDGGGDEEREES